MTELRNPTVDDLIEELALDESSLCPYCGANPEEEEYMCTEECNAFSLRDENTPFPLNFDEDIFL